MLIQCYCIHHHLTIRLFRSCAHPLDSYLLGMLKQYAVDDKGDRADLEIRIGGCGQSPARVDSPTLDFWVDNQWHISPDTIRVRGAHKGGRWRVRITNPDDPTRMTRIDITTNALGRMVFPYDVIWPLIKVHLNLRGVADVHGAGVARHGAGVVFAGRSGVGKTLTALNFASDGWQLLGDDEVWFAGPSVLGCTGPVSIRHAARPGRALAMRLSPIQRSAVFFTRIVSVLSAGTVNLFTRIDPQALGCIIPQENVGLRILYVLTPGDVFTVTHAYDSNAAVRLLVCNSRMEMRAWEGLRLAWVHINPTSPLADYWGRYERLIRTSLDGIDIRHAVMPGCYTRSVYEALRRDISPDIGGVS